MHLLKIARVPAVTVATEATARDAVDTMTRAGAGAVVIVEGENEAVGIFTATDLLRRVVARGRALGDAPILDVMTAPLTVAPAHASREQALQLMVSHHIRHLPIVDERNRVVAMLSTRHLLRSMVESLTHEVHSLNAFICADGIGG